MKKSLLYLPVLGVVLFMTSCGGNKNKEMLAKKWQWSEIKSEEMDEQIAQVKATADTTTDSTLKAMANANLQMITGMLEEMKKTTIEYKADGSYESAMTIMGQSKSEKGTWTISEDGKYIISTNEEKQTDTNIVGELTPEKLVLVGEDKGKKMSLVLTPAK